MFEIIGDLDTFVAYDFPAELFVVPLVQRISDVLADA